MPGAADTSMAVDCSAFSSVSDSNTNVNANYNVTSTDVSVHVDVSASVTPLIGDTSGGSFVLYMPQDIAQSISQNGNEIALDQINALTANNYADGNEVYQSANSSFNDNHTSAGEVHAGDAIQGALASGAMTANTSSSATIDAFTQSIVLGANLQNNSFTATIAGHDQTTHVGDISVGGHHG